MKYIPDIQVAGGDPQQLEKLYQTAKSEDQATEFAADMLACYDEAPDNVLYAAWYYRLQHPMPIEQARRGINWKLAVPLSALTGLIFWLFTLLPDEPQPILDFRGNFVLFWSSIVALFVMGFLVFTAKKHYRQFALLGVILVSVEAYVTLLAPMLLPLDQTPPYREHYQLLMLLHLPLLAWITTGVSVMGAKSSPEDRFAFLRKSIEVLVTAGVYLIAGVVFVIMTYGLFDTLRIPVSEEISQLVIAGGLGLIPLLAVASVYDPLIAPSAQEFRSGLGKIIATMMRLLLPLTLVVLIIYLVAIPFNLEEPFKDRDVLIVYNVMLFAIMGLLIGATPIRADELSPRYQTALRAGILALVVLTVLVSLYALSATVYRTALWGISVNRLTVIGWNVVNIGILVLLIYKQLRCGREQWVDALQSTFSLGSVGYVVWTLFLILTIPWLF